MKTKSFDLVRAVEGMTDDEYDAFLDSLTPAEIEEVVSVLEHGYLQHNVLARAVDAMNEDDYELFLETLDTDETALVAGLLPDF